MLFFDEEAKCLDEGMVALEEISVKEQLVYGLNGISDLLTAAWLQES